jgi:hypothetical protein
VLDEGPGAVPFRRVRAVEEGFETRPSLVFSFGALGSSLGWRGIMPYSSPKRLRESFALALIISSRLLDGMAATSEAIVLGSKFVQGLSNHSLGVVGGNDAAAVKEWSQVYWENLRAKAL